MHPMHPIRCDDSRAALSAIRSRLWLIARNAAGLMIVAALCTAGCTSAPVGGPRAAEIAGAPRPTGVVSRASGRAAPKDGPPGRAGPPFAYAYAPPQSPDLQEIHARVRDADLLRRLPEVQAIDGVFLLPRALHYVTAECGEFGAFYRPADATVVLCYETLRTLYERGQQQQRISGLGDDHPLRYTRANVRFIVLHETGHALVHLLDLPVTGRQEDAVDQLAAILMLHFADREETPWDVIGNLRMAANWMLSHSTGAYDLHAYADEHALGEQRYFNLQCLIYGTDPAEFSSMVETGDLTAARASGCVRETRQVGRAWLRLLLPHLAPAHAMSEADALDYLRQHGPRPQNRLQD